MGKYLRKNYSLVEVSCIGGYFLHVFTGSKKSSERKGAKANFEKHLGKTKIKI